MATAFTSLSLSSVCRRSGAPLFPLRGDMSRWSWRFSRPPVFHRHCAGGFDVDASRNEFGFYRGIRERNTNCVQARAVVHGYVAQLHGVAGSLDGKRVRVGGYVRTTTVTGSADNVTCSASRGRRVKFFGAP